MRTNTKPIKEIYPKHEWDIEHKDGFTEQSDYNPLLESLGHEILLKMDDEDYQGDSRILFKNGNSYGLLIFGWGSCSGCDALQACQSWKELEDLRNQLVNDIKWFDSSEDCLKYVKSHNWEGDFSWHAKETKEFVSKSVKILENEN